MIYTNQLLLRNWMLSRNKYEYTDGLVCLGHSNSKGEIVGVIGYDHWTGKTCEMHVVGKPYWLDKTTLWAAFDYPFNQAKCEQIFGKISTGDKSVIDFAIRVGFRQICTIPGVYPDGDEAVLSMYKTDCKWLEIKHGQKREATTST